MNGRSMRPDTRPHLIACPQPTKDSACINGGLHTWGGSVENTNGRLRRKLSRHLDLDTLSQADLQEIVLSLNLTPRKCLGYLTPIQAFFKGLGKDVQIKFA